MGNNAFRWLRLLLVLLPAVPASCWLHLLLTPPPPSSQLVFFSTCVSSRIHAGVQEAELLRLGQLQLGWRLRRRLMLQMLQMLARRCAASPSAAAAAAASGRAEPLSLSSGLFHPPRRRLCRRLACASASWPCAAAAEAVSRASNSRPP